MQQEITYDQKLAELEEKLFRKPPTQGKPGMPEWFHHHGTKFRVNRRLSTIGHLHLEASAASLIILRRERGKPEFEIRWQVVFSLMEKAEGRLLMTKEMLESAFGISNKLTSITAEWIINRYGGSVAHQGQYIRWDNFLNIPGPGLGHDGDPNVSVMIDDEIREYLHLFLDASEK